MELQTSKAPVPFPSKPTSPDLVHEHEWVYTNETMTGKPCHGPSNIHQQEQAIKIKTQSCAQWHVPHQQHHSPTARKGLGGDFL